MWRAGKDYPSTGTLTLPARRAKLGSWARLLAVRARRFHRLSTTWSDAR
jgi:hypothetical protein